MAVRVKFLKEHLDYKVNELADVSEGTAEYLKRVGVAVPVSDSGCPYISHPKLSKIVAKAKESDSNNDMKQEAVKKALKKTKKGE